MIEIKDHSSFFKIQSKFKHIPFSQSEGWYNYIKAQGREIAFFADHIPDTNVMCWGILQSVPLTGKKILQIEGDVFSEVTEHNIRAFYSWFKDSPYVGIEIDNNHHYTTEFEVGVRRAGFLRPIGSCSCPLTIEVDLTAEINFNREWKKSLKAAVNQNLHFKEITTPTSDDINSFVVLFDEMARIKNMIFRISYNSVSELLNSDDFRFFMVYDDKGIPLSGHIAYVKDDFAYAVFAGNSMLSRKCGAAHFLYKELLNLLKLEEIKIFDHGHIPPSDKRTDGVYQFKKGTGGNKVQYNGEYTYYKFRIVELAVFFYKCFKLKKQRY